MILSPYKMDTDKSGLTIFAILTHTLRRNIVAHY